MSETILGKRGRGRPPKVAAVVIGKRILRAGPMVAEHDPKPGGAVFITIAGGCRWLGMNLETTPQTPAARDAFDPDELEARIQAMSEKAAHEEGPRGHEVSSCWACGLRCPSGNYVTSAPGWVSRPLWSEKHKLVETYCGSCFAQWGWGDEWSGEATDAAGNGFGCRSVKLV